MEKLKAEVKHIVDNIIDDSIELMSKGSEDEITKKTTVLIKEIEKTGDTKAMIEFAILTLISELKENNV